MSKLNAVIALAVNLHLALRRRCSLNLAGVRRWLEPMHLQTLIVPQNSEVIDPPRAPQRYSFLHSCSSCYIHRPTVLYSCNTPQLRAMSLYNHNSVPSTNYNLAKSEVLHHLHVMKLAMRYMGDEHIKFHDHFTDA